jgi:hypothetical protein
MDGFHDDYNWHDKPETDITGHVKAALALTAFAVVATVISYGIRALATKPGQLRNADRSAKPQS